MPGSVNFAAHSHQCVTDEDWDAQGRAGRAAGMRTGNAGIVSISSVVAMSGISSNIDYIDSKVVLMTMTRSQARAGDHRRDHQRGWRHDRRVARRGTDFTSDYLWTATDAAVTYQAGRRRRTPSGRKLGPDGCR
jgi:hypothetical protein